jgi:hypothetical protein
MRVVNCSARSPFEIGDKVYSHVDGRVRAFTITEIKYTLLASNGYQEFHYELNGVLWVRGEHITLAKCYTEAYNANET